MKSDFISSVRKYCELIENHNYFSAEILLKECSVLLPMIYALSQDLQCNEDLLDTDIKDEKVDSPYTGLAVLFAEHLDYNLVFNPLEDNNVVRGNLADDLSDIYLDLKRPLLTFSRGGEKNQENPYWQWKFNISSHSGNHILNSLKTIHWINHHYDSQNSELTAE